MIGESLMSIEPNTFINWFRESSPYIHAHRNKTFVIYFGGEMVLDGCDNLIHDFALLKSLGIKLILVHGIRPQIDQRLKQQSLTPVFENNVRITNENALHCVKEAAGIVRVEIEALLSMGLSNSPMAGAKIKVASGNFVIAKPIGIVNGIDYQYTGLVRRVEHTNIQQLLDTDHVILISPLGYSPSGEVFNLVAEQVATEVAIALKADKLILLTEDSCKQNQQLVKQMTTKEAENFLISENAALSNNLIQSIKAATQSCQRGVNRAHLINRHDDGSLLLELFSRDGSGTLISSEPFEEIRSAKLNDIPGILDLIKPLEEQGILVKRSREKLEMQINDYIVIERDGLIIGCTALHVIEPHQSAEIACLAVHTDYQKSSRGNRLLEHLLVKAKANSIRSLYVLSTQTMHWFLERGFEHRDIDSLPKKRQAFYNFQRNAKVLVKNL